MAWSLAGFSSETKLSYQTLPFTIHGAKERIVPADLSGDGLTDLLVADTHSLSLYLQSDGEQRFDFSKASATLQLPGSATGWDIDYASGRSSGTASKRRIVALVDGKQIVTWEFNGTTFSEPKTLLENLQGFLPRGFYPMSFVSDINGDGYSDFLVPGTGEVMFYLGSAAEYGTGKKIIVDTFQNANLWSQNNLQTQVGGSVNITSFVRRDINNDGLNDIFSRNGSDTNLFLAGADGTYPEKPSMATEVDRELSINMQDIVAYLDNLSRLSNRTNFDYFFDADGDDVDDYIIKQENKISIFFGTKTGFDLSKPDQILKSGGNLLMPVFYDEDGDGAKDLVLVRLEDISLGDLILKAVIASSIKIEGFIYKNKGKSFSTRPHRKLTLSIDLPAFVKLPKILNEIENRSATRTARVALDPDRKEDDILVLKQDVIDTYKDITLLQDQDYAELLENLIGVHKGRDDYRLDLEDLVSITENMNLLMVKGLAPTATIAIDATQESIDLEIADIKKTELNNDGRDDLFVFTDRTQDSVSGYILLSGPSL